MRSIKIQYVNQKLERTMQIVSFAAVLAVGATFVLLYGFDRPLLPRPWLHTIQLVLFAVFLTEKLTRFFNAESRREFIRYNWYEFPLLAILLLVFATAGRWFLIEDRGLAILIAVDTYLVLQVIAKSCSNAVELAASGLNPAISLMIVFIVLIVAGGGLLMLPRSHNLESMSFTDAVFTAASATCVTGLVVHDTGKDFSRMGQIVILTLVQLGGLGIVIFGAVTALLLGHALSVRESAALQDLLSARTISQISRIIAFIFLTTVLIELIGAVCLYPMWDNVPEIADAPAHRWYYSIFYAISAFCNAGFSLLPDSLMSYDASVPTYAVLLPLIVLGGLGFNVIYNLFHAALGRISQGVRRRMHEETIFHRPAATRLHLQTKIVLTVTPLLAVLGAAAIVMFEVVSPQPDPEGLVRAAFFQAVASRTAGFNTVDIEALSEASKFVMMVLMFIGGSPASTAGGIKTTTFAVIVMVAWASIRKRREVEMFGRSIRSLIVGRAITVTLLFVLVLLVSTTGLIVTERHSGFAFSDLLFETVSALCTVGLSTGPTPFLTTGGKWIIILTMLIGRLGPLTLVAGLTQDIRSAGYEYPAESVVVG